MSIYKPEKEKAILSINKYESNSTIEKNLLIKNKIFSNQKFINEKNLDILHNRRLFHLKKNNYFKYTTSKEKIANQVSYKRNNSHNNNLFYSDRRDKEKLIMEINQSNNELKIQDKEIKKFKNLYGTIKKENLENHFLLSQIMNKKRNKKDIYKEQSKENNIIETEKEIVLKDQISTNNNNDKNSMSSKEDKYSNSKYDTHSFFLTGTNLLFDKDNKNNNLNKAKSSNMKKNKTCYLKHYNNYKESSKLKLLKKELDYYARTINEDTKKLEKFKENHKISGYLRAKEKLFKKNKELDDLVKISYGLQEKINEHDMIIYFFKLKNNNFTSLINEMKKKIDIKYKPIVANLKKRAKKWESQKEILDNQNKLYKNEIDTLKEENEKIKKKEIELKEFIEKNKKILEEKTKYNLELTNTFNNEQKLKQKMDLKSKKIEKMKKSNKDLSEYITKIEKEQKDELILKTENEFNQQEKIKKLWKQINDINKEMQKYSYKSIIGEKNMENEINKNFEILEVQNKEIEYLENKEKNIVNDIKNLNKELEKISEESKNQRMEMEFLIKNFEDIKNKNNIVDKDNLLKE
jgi:hypothetical protein